MSDETPAAEGARILAEIKAMSEENATNYGWLVPAARAARAPWEVPWLVALTVLVRREDALVSSAGRRVLPMYDGDRPTRMSDEYVRTVEGQSEDERRKDLESRDELGIELHRRARHYRTSTRRPQPTPRTHHAWIHRALGHRGPGVGSPGCPWCDRS